LLPAQHRPGGVFQGSLSCVTLACVVERQRSSFLLRHCGTSCVLGQVANAAVILLGCRFREEECSRATVPCMDE
jgi:hypothetical protein